MLHSKKARWIALASLAALLLAAGAAAAGDGDREGGRGKHGGRRERMALFAKAKRARAFRSMDRAMDRTSSLGDEQAKAALEASRDLAKIREEARGKAAALMLDAWRQAKAAGGKDATPEQRKALRAATRERMRALREEYRAPIAEVGMRVVKSLTPEQRAKIEAFAKEHGKPVDDAKLARRFGHRLSRPWAGALLKARLERGAETPTVPEEK